MNEKSINHDRMMDLANKRGAAAPFFVFFHPIHSNSSPLRSPKRNEWKWYIWNICKKISFPFIGLYYHLLESKDSSKIVNKPDTFLLGKESDFEVNAFNVK